MTRAIVLRSIKINQEKQGSEKLEKREIQDFNPKVKMHTYLSKEQKEKKKNRTESYTRKSKAV